MAAPILARWLRWRPWRASRPWSGQVYLRFLHPNPERFNARSGVSRVAIALALSRELFARLTRRSLDYYLSRELSNHIGAGKRFRDDRARSQFDVALNRHCREASRIIEAFAGGWYGKNVYQGDGLTPEAIRRFAPVAFKKVRAELRKRRDAEA